MTQDRVLLVDEQDRELGTMEKLEAHEKGVLHRAFSAFVFRRVEGALQVLLQKRAKTKYHFGGLWTNTCCGHPLEGETPAQAGMRRLPEEMNFQCALRPTDHFIYKARSENQLFEHELDHVLVGHFSEEPPAPNPAEADDARWVSVLDVQTDLAADPAKYTPWFPRAFEIAVAHA